MTSRPYEDIWTLATAPVAARCAYLIADIGVADCIGDEPILVADLAARCGANPDALDRILRLLTAHGVFERRAGAYAHTPSSRLLCTDDPASMRAFVRMM